MLFRAPARGLDAADAADGPQKSRREVVEFARVVGGKLLEHRRAVRGNGEDNLAAILWVFGADEELFSDAAVDQADSAVMAQIEALGYISDGCDGARRRACDLQEQLVLLRMQARVERSLLAEVKEAAQVVAEVGQGAEKGFGAGFRSSLRLHICIVAGCNLDFSKGKIRAHPEQFPCGCGLGFRAEASRALAREHPRLNHPSEQKPLAGDPGQRENWGTRGDSDSANPDAITGWDSCSRG